MSAPTAQRLVKLSIFSYKKADISEEAFHQHWSERYAPLAEPWLRKHGVVRYTQYHLPGAARAALAPMAAAAGWQVADWDGVMEFHVADMGVLAAATADPDYATRILPDEAQFFDQSKTVVTVGWEEAVI